MKLHAAMSPIDGKGVSGDARWTSENLWNGFLTLWVAE